MVKRASRPRPHTFASDSVAFWPRSVGVAFAEPLSSSQPSQPHRAQPPAPGTSRQRKRQARNVARAWQGGSRTRFSLESIQNAHKSRRCAELFLLSYFQMRAKTQLHINTFSTTFSRRNRYISGGSGPKPNKNCKNHAQGTCWAIPGAPGERN